MKILNEIKSNRPEETKIINCDVDLNISLDDKYLRKTSINIPL